MYRPTPTPQQMLTHSEVPGHSGLFVLGFQERHVNFYSQQVRALNLILALDLEGRLAKRPTSEKEKQKQRDQGKPVSATRRCRVCVVGGGAGGAMAAAAAALCGCEVTLFERHKDLFPHPGTKDAQSPQDGLQRTIHPHLMHWPYITGQGDRAGLPFMDWTAGPINKVLDSLRDGFDKVTERIELENGKRDDGKPLLEKKCCTRVQTIRRNAQPITTSTPPNAAEINWHANFEVSYFENISQNTSQNEPPEVFDLVILATGFSGERGYPGVPLHSYWEPGLLKKINKCGSKTQKCTVLVSGTGDGGVEDAIQLALRKLTPVHKLVEFLFESDNQERTGKERELHESVMALKSWLMDVERLAHAVDPSKQSKFLNDTWEQKLKEGSESPLYPALEEIRAQLRPQLRQNKCIHIILNSPDVSFQSLGASVVHRLILYVIQTLNHPKVEVTFEQGKLVPEDSEPAKGHYVLQSKKELKHIHADELILRHGPMYGVASIEFVPGVVMNAIQELRTRNVLDQTRFPLWPIYGNPLRFTRFKNPSEFEALSACKVNEFDALAAEVQKQSGAAPLLNALPELSRKIPLPKVRKPNQSNTTDLMHAKKAFVEFVYVPSGTYRLGGITDDAPSVNVTGFWISRYPITVEQYAQFVRDSHHEWPVGLRDVDLRARGTTLQSVKVPNDSSEQTAKPLGTDPIPQLRSDSLHEMAENPITDISWIDAMHFCHWAGFSLPTAAQWEAACTGHLVGADIDRSPHQPKFSETYIHFRNPGRVRGTTPVATYQVARSPFGVVQPLGNVWEFCLDAWEENPQYTRKGATEKEREDPLSINDLRHREFRGGSWFDWYQPTPFLRGHNHDRNRSPADGFRVVWIDPKGPSDKEKEFDRRIEGVHFPLLETKSSLEDITRNAGDAGYLATPALRRLASVHPYRKAPDADGIRYYSLKDLRSALEEPQEIAVVLGSFNTNTLTGQPLLALSCDGWHVSELTRTLVQRSPNSKIRTCLAEELQEELKKHPQYKESAKNPLALAKKSVISTGSGNVSVVSEWMVVQGIVPSFEQSTASVVFGEKTFFPNPDDSLGVGVLVAYEEIVDHEPVVRILVAGRSGYATAAAIALLNELLENRKVGSIEPRDDMAMRLVFRGKRKGYAKNATTGGVNVEDRPAPAHWQDIGVPDLETLEMVEEVSLAAT